MKKYFINCGKSRLYDHLGLIARDFDADETNGFLTENVDKNGESWYWYMDNTNNAAINIKTGEIVDDPSEIDKLFL